MIRALCHLLQSPLADDLRAVRAVTHEVILGPPPAPPRTLPALAPVSPRCSRMYGPIAVAVATLSFYGCEHATPQLWCGPDEVPHVVGILPIPLLFKQVVSPVNKARLAHSLSTVLWGRVGQ